MRVLPVRERPILCAMLIEELELKFDNRSVDGVLECNTFE